MPGNNQIRGGLIQGLSCLFVTVVGGVLSPAEAGRVLSLSPVSGRRIPGVSAHQAHKRRERLLQVGQVRQAGGERATLKVSSGLLYSVLSPQLSVALGTFFFFSLVATPLDSRSHQPITRFSLLNM